MSNGEEEWSVMGCFLVGGKVECWSGYEVEY